MCVGNAGNALKTPHKSIQHSAATARIAMANGATVLATASHTLCIVYNTHCISNDISINKMRRKREHEGFCCYFMNLFRDCGTQYIPHTKYVYRIHVHPIFLCVLLCSYLQYLPGRRAACTLSLSCAEHKPSQSIVAPNKYAAYN